MLNIDIVYHNPNIPKLEKVDNGDWIDLRASVGGTFKKGDFALIDLGVSMRLPEGYEAHIAPRSSTFKHWGIFQVNSVGVIDNSFSGTNDVWKMPCLFTRDTVIEPNDRICQFRIVKKMEPVSFTEAVELDNTDRGGFGSSGRK
uniref:dUTP diphosphatase n=1 Tax=Siphoviridae sp. ctKy93 TaxID=2827569 RepID=A0A8S5RRD9_9CAUD|nr:MAG TPA: dUTPase [Siphoviridae sp. ctKy93]